MAQADLAIEHFENPAHDQAATYAAASRAAGGFALGDGGAAAARADISTWRGYHPTPLVSLAGLAREAGWSALWIKDESGRFDIASFKALGGAYAVARQLRRAIARHHPGRPAANAADLERGRYAAITRAVTVCCATDGNHGRSVAWGAGRFGCRAVIYIHATVTAEREAAIAGYGAQVRRVPGTFDDAVRQAAEDAAAQGWTVIPDTSYPGAEEVPRDVMHGYTVMADEAFDAIPGAAAPSHIFIQGGVGGLAAAVCARAWARWGARRPRFVVVEPERAACLLASARAGRRVRVGGDLETVMAGLACGEPSLIAWPILAHGARDFVTLPDAPALEAMTRLARPAPGDAPLVIGESGVAGLAAALAAARRADLAAALGLDRASRVLVFGTEGDTDPAFYREIVGRDAARVRAS